MSEPKNVEIEVSDNGIATITVDLNEEGVMSKSEKSLVIATTRGSQPITEGSDVMIGLNIYRKLNK